MIICKKNKTKIRQNKKKSWETFFKFWTGFYFKVMKGFENNKCNLNSISTLGMYTK